MYQGIGNDIIEVGRIRIAIERYGDKFLDKLFTSDEKDYCLRHRDPATRFAGRFAAKEAIVKALGIGFGSEIGWQDIEILNDGAGKPVVTFAPRAVLRFCEPKILLSISHCKEYANAVAVRLQ